MSPREKASELFDKCYYKIEDATAGLFENDVDYLTARRKAAQWCALITVQVILDECIKETAPLHYWVSVKSELETL